MRLAIHPTPSLLTVLAVVGTAAVAASAPGWPPPSSPPDPAIAFLDGGAIKVMNADGSNVRTVISGQGARCPEWSSDSTELVYYGNPGGAQGVAGVEA